MLLNERQDGVEAVARSAVTRRIVVWPALLMLAGGSLVPAGSPAFAQPPSVPSPTPSESLDRQRTSLVMRVPAGRMAEPTAAIDPADPDHIAVAADPYLNPVRILVSVTRDGGRTWTRPITVRPPGFAKSYDPDLAFTRSGALLVSGGASRIGRPYCQPGSVVFLARVAGSRPSYELITRPQARVYVDRPALAHDQVAGHTAVSWTRSTGRGAECRAVPTRSTTWLAWRLTEPRRFIQLRVPVRQPAAYGSELAADGAGRVRVAVAGWYPDGRQVVSVTGMDLARGAPYATATFPAGRRPPLSLGRGLPLNLSAPSITKAGGRFMVTWTEGAGRRITSRVAVNNGPTWRVLPGPNARTPMLPTVTAAPDGAPLVLQADVERDHLTFTVWRRTQARWALVRDLGGTSAKNYPELGELLGLASVRSTVVAAVPAGRRPSALAVSVWTIPGTHLPAPTPENSSSGPRHPSQPWTAVAVVGLVIAVLVGGLLRSRGRHAGRSNPPAKSSK